MPSGMVTVSTAGATLERFRERLSGAHRRIVVLGDIMLDEYIYGKVSRISPEAPVPVLEADMSRRTYALGGAANVARNLVALGLDVSLVGVVGDDAAASMVREMLTAEGINAGGVVTDKTRPTTLKTRIVAHNQQVVRVDHESREPLDIAARALLVAAVRDELGSSSCALLVSDYDKGVVAGAVSEEWVRDVRANGCLVTANPKPTNVLRLMGADLVSLNRMEYLAVCQLLGIDGSGACWEEHVLTAREKLQVGLLLVTCGGEGLWTASSQGCAHFDAVPVEVYDTVGAGDSVVSAATAAMVAGLSWREVGKVGNWAGGAVVRKAGTAAVTMAEIASVAEQEHAEECVRDCGNGPA